MVADNIEAATTPTATAPGDHHFVVTAAVKLFPEVGRCARADEPPAH